MKQPKSIWIFDKNKYSEKWTAFKSGTNRFFVVATDPTLLFAA